jgi:hypothetical protein
VDARQTRTQGRRRRGTDANAAQTQTRYGRGRGADAVAEQTQTRCGRRRRADADTPRMQTRPKADTQQTRTWCVPRTTRGRRHGADFVSVSFLTVARPKDRSRRLQPFQKRHPPMAGAVAAPQSAMAFMRMRPAWGWPDRGVSSVLIPIIYVITFRSRQTSPRGRRRRVFYHGHRRRQCARGFGGVVEASECE